MRRVGGTRKDTGAVRPFERMRGPLRRACGRLLLLPLLLLPWFLSLSAPAGAAGPDVLFREDFDSLARWEPLTFPKIPSHSRYTAVREGTGSFLKAESVASASAIVHRQTFNVYRYPRLRWRWKVERLEDRGDPREKPGDDYPLRLYVHFPYDPEKATLGERLRYGAAHMLYGRYPPHSTLNYVWTARELPGRIIPSPYTARAAAVLVEKGTKRAGEWLEATANILDDYREAFGSDPPADAALAVMSDTDNGGGSAVAYIDFIEVGRAGR